jgi:Lipoprotein NlpI, contains TPR repeats
MRKSILPGLAAGAALALLALSGPGTSFVSSAFAAATAEAKTKPEDDKRPVIRSFAGAFLAGRTADVDNDTEAAIAFYKKALEYDRDNTEIRERLMVAQFVGGHFDDGVKTATELADDEAVAQVRQLALAIDAIRKGEYEKAAAMVDTTATNPIDRLLNTLVKSWAEFGAGKGEAAIAKVKALDGPPWYPVFTLFHAAAMAEALGKTDMARDLYKSNITDKARGGAAPDTYIRAVMALASLEAREGNARAALDTLAVGEDFSPGYAPLAALRQQIETGRKPEREIGDAKQGAASIFFTLGSALNREGAEETVGLYLQFARALDPTNAATLVLLGSLKEAIGKPEEAIAIYKEVPASSPMRRISELQMGLALADLDRGTEARQHLKALIEADPKDLRSYLAYGSVLSAAKDYKAMAENYEKAVAAAGPAPTRADWNLFFQLGIAYERLKEWPKAEANFKRALQLYPDQPQVMNYLGYSWIDMNMNLEEGMKMIQGAVDLRPNDGYIVDSLGWAYYRLGKYEDAVRELERAIELKPADATINDHLGDAYWRVGRKLEAGFQWNRALASEPDEDLRPKILEKLEKGLDEASPATPAVGETEGAKPKTPAAATPDPEPKKTEAAPALPGQDGQPG